MEVYSELELLAGSVLIGDEGGQIRDGDGDIVRKFSSNLSMNDVLRYYDKELKSKGWSFKDVDISRRKHFL